jgi:hypothetical protein
MPSVRTVERLQALAVAFGVVAELGSVASAVADRTEPRLVGEQAESAVKTLVSHVVTEDPNSDTLWAWATGGAGLPADSRAELVAAIGAQGAPLDPEALLALASEVIIAAMKTDPSVVEIDPEEALRAVQNDPIRGSKAAALDKPSSWWHETAYPQLDGHTPLQAWEAGDDEAVIALAAEKS